MFQEAAVKDRCPRAHPAQWLYPEHTRSLPLYNWMAHWGSSWLCREHSQRFKDLKKKIKDNNNDNNNNNYNNGNNYNNNYNNKDYDYENNNYNNNFSYFFGREKTSKGSEETKIAMDIVSAEEKKQTTSDGSYIDNKVAKKATHMDNEAKTRKNKASYPTPLKENLLPPEKREEEVSSRDMVIQDVYSDLNPANFHKLLTFHKQQQ